MFFFFFLSSNTQVWNSIWVRAKHCSSTWCLWTKGHKIANFWTYKIIPMYFSLRTIFFSPLPPCFYTMNDDSWYLYYYWFVAGQKFMRLNHYFVFRSFFFFFLLISRYILLLFFKEKTIKDNHIGTIVMHCMNRYLPNCAKLEKKI